MLHSTAHIHRLSYSTALDISQTDYGDCLIPHLCGHVLDPHKLPRWIHVTDLYEPRGGSGGEGLLPLLLLVEAWPLGDRLGHGDPQAPPLLPRWSHRDVQPGHGREGGIVVSIHV